MQDAADLYMARALDMSNSLGWFGFPMGISTELDAESSRRLKANAHAAWGIFNYVT